ncbi:MBL fold metallo-hydrolase [Arthrobacter sp. NPDC090010]|uniref:MBL fold metallo-hydrolase n=1 Tax=Arthrobacter sp. NPDC090010 TaxID=3363942 RepID=UPI0038309DDC
MPLESRPLPWAGTDLTPGRLVAVAPGVRVLLAPNPGPMSLNGTQSYVLGADGECLVVDPGPEDERHLALLAGVSPATVLVTHRHADHTAGVDRLHELSGAPVRAAAAGFCRSGAPLRDGETLGPAGELRVVSTPGHTSDSLSFHWTGERGSYLLSGDTILGAGTTMLDHPDGSLRNYLGSLERLAGLAASNPGTRVLPAHGGLGAGLAAVVNEYRAHRLARLAEVRTAVAQLGDDVDAVTARVYPDVPNGVLPAARLSIAAQLRYLREHAGTRE